MTFPWGGAELSWASLGLFRDKSHFSMKSALGWSWIQVDIPWSMPPLSSGLSFSWLLLQNNVLWEWCEQTLDTCCVLPKGNTFCLGCGEGAHFISPILLFFMPHCSFFTPPFQTNHFAPWFDNSVDELEESRNWALTAVDNYSSFSQNSFLFCKCLPGAPKWKMILVCLVKASR